MTERLIQRLDSWLSTSRGGYYAQLQSGLTDSELDRFEVRMSLTLPAEFRSLYRWRNCQSPSCTESLQGNRMFSSLDEIAETKADLDSMIRHDFDDPRWWRTSWIPFLANGGGDHLCLDLAAEDGGVPGQLISSWHDWEERTIEFASLTDWLIFLLPDSSTP
jgi:cell wall assembly regulator SMI1